jgi:hypothetical protein
MATGDRAGTPPFSRVGAEDIFFQVFLGAELGKLYDLSGRPFPLWVGMFVRPYPT